MENQILCASVISSIQTAVALASKRDIVNAVKDALLLANCNHQFQLPKCIFDTCSERYARRLLYKDPDMGFIVVAMTWGIGQGTPLHDHAGTWCVETVLYGTINVQQYDLLDTQGELFQFHKMDKLECGVGTAGTLIPPYDYHAIANASDNDVAITLHVYGKNMTECGSYALEHDNWYKRSMRKLSYDPITDEEERQNEIML